MAVGCVSRKTLLRTVDKEIENRELNFGWHSPISILCLSPKFEEMSFMIPPFSQWVEGYTLVDADTNRNLPMLTKTVTHPHSQLWKGLGLG